LENGYDVVIVDNLSNSKQEVIENIKSITNKDFKFYKADLIDKF
jgi:UDP-glucose 4-epimerase